MTADLSMTGLSKPERLPPDLAETRALFPPDATAFFLDVDGTLLGFKDRPEDVVADPALIALLRQLHDAAGGALALVSGRTVPDLDRIVAPLVLPAAGMHGADIRFADHRRALIDASILDPFRAEIRAFVAARPGLMFEDKGATLAIHCRLAPEREAEVHAFLLKMHEGHDLAIQLGKLVAELKPPTFDKGQAIITLMETPPFAGRRALFIGDDLTDEHGFRAVNVLSGFSIKVGVEHEATIARYSIADPREVRILLSNICRLAAP